MITVLTFEKSLSVNVQIIKATEEYFPVMLFAILYNVVLVFKLSKKKSKDFSLFRTT